jgi:hypothetical protein
MSYRRRLIRRRSRAAAIALAIPLFALAPAAAVARPADNGPTVIASAGPVFGAPITHDASDGYSGVGAKPLGFASATRDASDGYSGLNPGASTKFAPTVVRERTVIHDNSGRVLPITLAAVALLIAALGAAYMLVRVVPQQRQMLRGLH